MGKSIGKYISKDISETVINEHDKEIHKEKC